MTSDPLQTACCVIPSGRVAGIDYGRKRIGIAICDAQRIVASPFAVRHPGGDAIVEACFYSTLVAAEDIVGFVVGLPVHADGRDSEMSLEVERFGGWLSTATNRPVVFHDERYSSIEAVGLMTGRGLSRKKKKARTDALAAQIVLTAWIESSAASGVFPTPGNVHPGALNA